MSNSLPGSPPPDGLAKLRRQLTGDGERTVWACLLEATAVKAGNVHPTASFADLTYCDFVAAAEAIAPVMDRDADGLGELVLGAVRATRRRCQSNVNLGIILLVAPLTLASRRLNKKAKSFGCNRSGILRDEVQAVLSGLAAVDGELVFQAIREANPGGLGDAAEMDVRETTNVDLIAAMELAAERDLIARQYATGFAILFDRVVPVLRDALVQHGDWLEAIRWGQLALLAAIPDTLIERKCGKLTAEQTVQRARAVLQQTEAESREQAWNDFDRWLRGDAHRRNPGAIADLIAAGIWILLHRTERDST